MRFLGQTKFKFLIYGLGIVSFISLLFGYKAFAAPSTTQPVSLTTTPIVLDLNTPPGSTTTQVVQAMNNNKTPVSINMELMTFSADGDTGDAAITAIPKADPSGSYVSFSPKSFVAQPKVWSKVNVTIKLPKSASLGYYYAIVFQPVYTIGPHKGKNIIESSNAILALLNTNSGNETKNVQVASFSVSKRFYEYLPATFSVNIRNAGNIFLAPQGDIFISRSGVGGKSLAVLPVNKGGGNVLPNSNRIFTASWADGFPVYVPALKNGQPVYNKHSQIEQKLKWNFGTVSKFRFGRYYANLLMTYNNGTKTVLLNGQVDFWVIPWEILLVLIVIFVILLLNLFLIGRAIYRRVRWGRYGRGPR